MSRVIFVGDETDDLDIQQIFEALNDLGVEGRRAHPRDISMRLIGQRAEFVADGEVLNDDLIVGWVFETWLFPGMAMLEAMEQAGLAVINRARTLFVGQNKMVMSSVLQRHGIRHEPTGVCYTLPEAELLAQQMGYPVVIKPGVVISGDVSITNSGGGVVRVFDREALQAVCETVFVMRHPVYLQRYVERPENRDIRVWYAGFRPVKALFKVPRQGGWVTNTHFGVDLVDLQGAPEMLRLGADAARVVDAPLAGVDIAETPDGGYTVLEVNTCPTFAGAEHLYGRAIPQFFAQYLAERFHQRRSERRSSVAEQ